MSKDPSYNPGGPIQPDAGDVGAGNHGSEGVGENAHTRKEEVKIMDLQMLPDSAGAVNKMTHFK